MDGSWRVGNRPARMDHRARIILEANDIRAVGVDLGVLDILDRDHDGDVVAHLGPDLLGCDWDPEVATAEPDGPPRPAVGRGAAGPAGAGRDRQRLLQRTVLRQRTIADRAGQRPGRPACLVTRARDMLWTNRLRWNRCTTGDTRAGRQLWVYGRAGQPCRRCGTPLNSDDTGERVAYWCPACQR